jgi:YVTN family beta-propeller protein
MKLSRRALLPLPLLGLMPAFAAGADLAMVMNSGEASVSVIDMGTRKVVATVPTLREPSHWALSPDRSKLYIADSSGNALFILDPQSGAALGHVVMPDPYQLGYSPDGKYLMVNALRLDQVDVYDAATLRPVKRFKPGRMPSHLDFSPDGQWSFNSCQGSDTLVSFDLRSMTTRWTAKVGSTPAGVLFHGGQVLCCVMGSDHVAVVDPVSGAVVRTVRTGVGPHNLFLSPDKGTLYVSNRVGGSLAVLDAASLTLRRTIPLPGGPDDLGVAPDGKLWIALRFRGQVAVMDAGTGDYETIDVGRSPHGVFLNTEMRGKGRVTGEVL